MRDLPTADHRDRDVGRPHRPDGRGDARGPLVPASRPAAVLWLAGMLLVCSSCHRGPYAPAELVPDEDRCENCRMAISEKPFAGQVMTARGKALFFDDLGCLVVFVRGKGLPAGATAYVVDFHGGDWIPAAGARFLWAKTLQTPMGCGLAAFRDEAGAGRVAGEHPGEVLDWEGLIREWSP